MGYYSFHVKSFYPIMLVVNIYINGLFYQFINTHSSNFADDTTLSAFSINLEELLHNLEYDTHNLPSYGPKLIT